MYQERFNEQQMIMRNIFHASEKEWDQICGLDQNLRETKQSESQEKLKEQNSSQLQKVLQKTTPLNPSNKCKSKSRRKKKTDPQFQELFTQKEIQLGKCTNTISLLARNFIYNFQQVGGEYYKNNPKIYKKVISMVEDLKQKYQNDNNSLSNLNVMRTIFGHNEQVEDTREISELNRRVGQKLIRKIIIPDLLKNKKIKNIKEYLFSLKVLMLRARNPSLIVRAKCH